MQVKALKTFRNKEFGTEPDGLVRTGLVITAPDHVVRQWIRLGLVEVYGPPSLHEPQRNTALSGPDHLLEGDDGENDDDDEDVRNGEDDMNESVGEDAEDEECDPENQSSDEDPQDDGEARRSSSQRRAHRSRKKTSRTSRGGRK